MAASAAVLAGRAAVEVGLKSKIDSDARKIQAQLRALARSFSDLGAPLLAIGSSGTLAGLGILSSLSVPVRLAADMEMTASAFETMLKSADKTRVLLADLTKFAAQTPFEFPELADTAKLMIAFGSSSESVVSELRMIGDVSSAIGQPIKDIALIYGKARTSGRLFASDINELGGRGVPIIRELAKQFNVSESEVRGLVEQGKVGFPELQRVFRDLTTGAGQFAGGMEKASKTTKGQWSSMKDAIVAAVRPIGDALLPTVKQYIATITTLAGRVQTWVEANKELIPTIAQAVVGMTAASAAVGGVGAALIALSSASRGATVVVEAVATGWRLLSTLAKSVTAAITGLSAANSLETGAAAVAATANTKLTQAVATAAGAMTAAAKAAVSAGGSTAQLGIQAALSAAKMVSLVVALQGAGLAALEYAAAMDVASAATIDIPGLGGKKKRKSGTRGPRKPKATEVDIEPGQSLIIPGRKSKRPASQGPVGLIEGPASSIASAAASTATAATVVTSQAGMIGQAFALVARVGSVASSAITSVFASIGAAVGASTAAVVAGVAVIGGAVAYIANRAGLLSRAWNYVTRVFNDVFGTVKQSVGGITAAIQNGRWDLAAKIAWTGFKLVTIKLLDETIKYMWHWKQVAFDSIVDFGLALRDTLWDLFKQIPRLLRAALTGAESIGSIINDAIAGKLSSPDSFLSKTKTQLQKELDDLTAEAKKLDKGKAGKPSESQSETSQQAPSASTAPNAITAPATNAAGTTSAADVATAPEQSAAQQRIAALRKEIETMRVGEQAAELLELARAGATRQELLAVAALQRAKLATEQLNEKRQEEADAIQRQKDELKASSEQLKEAAKTPEQQYQERVAQIQQMQKSGLINQQQAAHGYAGAMNDLRAANPAANQTPVANTLVRAGTPEATQVIQAHRAAIIRRAREAATMADANRMAAAGASSPTALAGADGKPPKDPEMLKLQQDQLRVLQEIQRGLTYPTVQKRMP